MSDKELQKAIEDFTGHTAQNKADRVMLVIFSLILASCAAVGVSILYFLKSCVDSF